MADRTAKGIFIFYARKDGTELARCLHQDLTKADFNVWLDPQRLSGGVPRTREIEESLDRSDIVLALLTQGSFRSEICRAEQLRSLRKGKVVIPLLGPEGQ